MRRAVTITLSPAERGELEAWTTQPGSSDRLRMRARIVLEAAGGRTNGEIARYLGIHNETAARWRKRFAVNRVEGLRREAPRARRTRIGGPELVDRVLRMTVDSSPSDGAPWTTRSLARALNVSHMFIHRVWKAHGVSPSSPVTSPSSFLERPWVDVVGVYIDTPAAALVLAVGVREGSSDEPTAHPRMDPDISGGFPLPSHQLPAALAEALSRAEELLPRATNGRHSPHELLVFLRNLDENTPAGTQLHLVLDRPLESVSERVSAWLNTHPRFHVRTAPAAGSWIATVDERLRDFGNLPLHRDSFRGAMALTDSLTLSMSTDRPDRGPLTWTLNSLARPVNDARALARAPGSMPARSSPS